MKSFTRVPKGPTGQKVVPTGGRREGGRGGGVLKSLSGVERGFRMGLGEPLGCSPKGGGPKGGRSEAPKWWGSEGREPRRAGGQAIFQAVWRKGRGVGTSTHTNRQANTDRKADKRKTCFDTFWTGLAPPAVASCYFFMNKKKEFVSSTLLRVSRSVLVLVSRNALDVKPDNSHMCWTRLGHIAGTEFHPILSVAANHQTFIAIVS